MTTTRTAPARFSVNVYTTGNDNVFAAVRSAVESLGATYDRGFGNLHKAQVFFTNTSGATLSEVREALAANLDSSVLHQAPKVAALR